MYRGLYLIDNTTLASFALNPSKGVNTPASRSNAPGWVGTHTQRLPPNVLFMQNLMGSKGGLGESLILVAERMLK